MKPCYNHTRLPCFSEGSVVADYYLLLNNLVGELSTQDVNVAVPREAAHHHRRDAGRRGEEGAAAGQPRHRPGIHRFCR